MTRVRGDRYCGLRIRIESALRLDVDGVAESTTCTVNDQMPRLVGVPAITPVAASSFNPGGSERAATDHRNGALPPDVASAAE